MIDNFRQEQEAIGAVFIMVFLIIFIQLCILFFKSFFYAHGNFA